MNETHWESAKSVTKMEMEQLHLENAFNPVGLILLMFSSPLLFFTGNVAWEKKKEKKCFI